MSLDFSGKNVVVTGGARGIGLTFVKSLVSLGANVLVLDKMFDTSLFGDSLKNITMFEIDLSKKNEFARLLSFVSEKYDKIDIVINNAGVTFPSSGDEPYPITYWETTLNVNLTAPFMVISTLLPYLQKSNAASIINIASLNSELGFPNNPAYVASKSALAGLTRSFAVDFGKYGIKFIKAPVF